MHPLTWVLDRLFGAAELQRQTDERLHELAAGAERMHRESAERALSGLDTEKDDNVLLGWTEWGQAVILQLSLFLGGHGMVTGATGSGKTVACLIIIAKLLELMPQTPGIGFGIIDALKSELYYGVLYLLKKLLVHLSRHDPEAAEQLRERIFIFDPTLTDPVSSYNPLARPADIDPELFAWNRADSFAGLLAVDDKLRAAGHTLLQRAILALSDPAVKESVLRLGEFLGDEPFRQRVLTQCANPLVCAYFSREFKNVPEVTVAAVIRRLDALMAGESVRSVFSGPTAPDFRRL